MRTLAQRLAVALAAAAFTFTAHASGHFYDAMALAIEHYNANHQRDLKGWGVEHSQMVAILDAVEKEIPALKGVSRLDYLESGNFGPNPFTTLSRELSLGSFASAEDRQLAESLEAQVTALTVACPFERTTTVHETDFGFTTPSKQTTVETRYRLDAGSSKKCSNALTQDLVRNGINLITLTKVDGEWSARLEVTFGQESNVFRDMAFVKANLLKVGALHDVVSALEVGDMTGAHVIGKSTDIQLVGSTGAAALTDSVRLQYSKGWGDCPAGCISHHQWLVDVTPTGSNEYRVQLVQESGTPLPADGHFGF